MKSTKRNAVRRADRVRLIVEVRRAYERLADILQRYRDDSPGMSAAFAQTALQLSRMNRALALAAVESARRSAAGRQ
jgi:hypothetical protein